MIRFSFIFLSLSLSLVLSSSPLEKSGREKWRETKREREREREAGRRAKHGTGREDRNNDELSQNSNRINDTISEHIIGYTVFAG